MRPEGELDEARSIYVTGSGQRLTAVHDRRNCEGNDPSTPCVIHNPTPGPWSSWPTFWRSDAHFMERICPCGIGHPAVEEINGSGVHGCCRCPCSKNFIDGEVIMKGIES